MRREIEKMGGEFRFHSQVTDLIPEEKVLIINDEEKIRAGAAVLAIGHSARDHVLYALRTRIRYGGKSICGRRSCRASSAADR